METQTPGICLSLPPLLWDSKCTTTSRVWTHILFHAGQELYQLSDLSLSEKFADHSFLTPDDPVSLGSPHGYRSCFALHKRKCQGLREWEAGDCCKHLQRQLRETIELPAQEQEKAWAVKRPSSHPLQQVPDPLRQAARVMSSPNAKHVITTLYACSVSKADDAFVCAFGQRVSLLHFSA